MNDDRKSTTPMRDREMLIPVAGGPDIAVDSDSKPSSSSSAGASSREVGIDSLFELLIG